MNQYKVDLLGSTTGDYRNTWKGVVETSLALHTSKFVRTRLDIRKEKEGLPSKKSLPTKNV